MYEQGVNIGSCSTTEKNTKQHHHETTPISGFISNTIINKYKNEGYKFVQNVDDSLMFNPNTEWEEELYDVAEEDSPGMITKSFHSMKNNNTNSHWQIRITSEGDWYYKNSKVTSSSTGGFELSSSDNTISVVKNSRRNLASATDHQNFDECSADGDSCTRLLFLTGVRMNSVETSGCPFGAKSCHRCINRCVGRLGYRYYRLLGYNCGTCKD
jgi:hypothetical protein